MTSSVNIFTNSVTYILTSKVALSNIYYEYNFTIDNVVLVNINVLTFLPMPHFHIGFAKTTIM